MTINVLEIDSLASRSRDDPIVPCADVSGATGNANLAEFLATEALVPMPRGGFKKATEYLLNKKSPAPSLRGVKMAWKCR